MDTKPFRHFRQTGQKPACSETIPAGHVMVQGFADVDCRPCLWELHRRASRLLDEDASSMRRNIEQRLGELDRAQRILSPMRVTFDPKHVRVSFGEHEVVGIPYGTLVELARPAPDAAPAPVPPPPRCEWVSLDGHRAIAAAEARGGATEGDIRALRDRFGCTATAAHELLAECDDEDDDFQPVLSCAAHVGDMLPAGKSCNVAPVVWPPPPLVTVSITQETAGVARAGFGPPVLLGSVPFAPFAEAPALIRAGWIDTLRDTFGPSLDCGAGIGRGYLEAIEKIRAAAGGIGGCGIGAELDAIRAAAGAAVDRGVRITTERCARCCGPVPAPHAVCVRCHAAAADPGTVHLLCGEGISEEIVTLAPTSVTSGVTDDGAVTWRIETPVDATGSSMLTRWQKGRELIRIGANLTRLGFTALTLSGDHLGAYSAVIMLREVVAVQPRERGFNEFRVQLRGPDAVIALCGLGRIERDGNFGELRLKDMRLDYAVRRILTLWVVADETLYVDGGPLLTSSAARIDLWPRPDGAVDVSIKALELLPVADDAAAGQVGAKTDHIGARSRARDA